MRRSILAVLGTAAVCAGMWIFTPKEENLEVHTINPERKDIVYSVSADGVIEQISSNSLYSSDYAVIDRIYVNPGDQVKKGQVLMSLKLTDQKTPQDQDVSEVLSDVFSQAVSEHKPNMSYSDGGMIISPIDGLITEVGVKETETVTPVTKCAVVSDVSRMQAVINVAEADIAKIKKGMPAEISGEAFNGTYEGVVLEISPQIKSKMTISGEGDKYATVVIELYKADKELLPGSSVHAKIRTSKKEGVLVLPYEAITQDAQNRETVYIVQNGRAAKRGIIAGYELYNMVEIVSGVSIDDRVILSPPDKLADGERVVIGN